MLTRIVADRVYDYSHVVGGRQVTGMLTLAVGQDDDVFVLLRRPNSSNVAKLSIGTTPGDEEIQTQFGSTGEGGGQLKWPAGLAVDSDENVYVTDEWLHRVSVFDSDGDFLRMFGEFGSGPGQFNRPSGIAIDGNDDVYVSDALNHRIQKLDKLGDPLYSFGQYGDGDGEFNAPWGLTDRLRTAACMWRTTRTTASRSSTRTASSFSDLESMATERRSSTTRRMWRWTRTATSTCATG